MRAIFGLLLLFISSLLIASDEESLGGPYAQFDPETGFYSSGPPTNSSPPPVHQASPPVAATPAPVVVTPTEINPVTESPKVRVADEERNTSMLMLAGSGILLLGAYFALRRNQNPG